MKSRIFPLLVFSHLGILIAQCCQPPFQAAAPMPPSPPMAFNPPSNGLVSGVQSHQPSISQPSLSNSIDNQELTLFNSNSEEASPTITPYPGYIPPPPPGSQFPTLIQAAERTVERNPLDDSALQQLNNELTANNGPYPPACSSSMNSLHDVISCLQFLPSLKPDINAMQCSFEEGSTCRFQSTSPAFQIAKFASEQSAYDFSRMLNKDTTTKPQGSFMSMIQRNTLPPNDKIVLSTPITCQTGNGNLSFEVWVAGNEDLHLQVCTQDYAMRSCTGNILFRESSMVVVEVIHPNGTVYDIEITMSNLVKPTIVVIDNLKYEADLCEANTSVEKEHSSDDFLPSVDVVNSFFEEESPATEESEGTTDGDRFIAIPPRPESSGIQSFNGQEIAPPAPVSPQDHTKSMSSDSPPAMTPFDSTFKPTVAMKKMDVCTLLNCDFNGVFCSYRSYKNNTFTSEEWNLGADRIGNPHTGIRSEDQNDGGFLYVGADKSDNTLTTYILESPSLTLEHDLLFSLDVYRRTNDITLQICFNTPFYCPFTASPFEKDVFWKKGETFNIPKTTKKIFLKAIQWRRFKWLAIDNIRVNSVDC